MKRITTNVLNKLLIVPAFALMLSFAVLPYSQPVAAFDGTMGSGAGSAQGTDQAACLFECEDGSNPIFRTITNVLLFIVGAISVIMLIIGGIRYTTSMGDSTAVTAAKNTILYAVIGIIISLLAFAVVNFVIGSFANN